MRKRDFKNVVIVLLCFVVISMSIGFAYSQSNEEIVNKQNDASALWDVEISSIRICTADDALVDSACVAPVGNASNIEEGTKIDELDKTKASFSTNLTTPGDQITYKVVVANKGTLPARLSDISFNKSLDVTNPIIFSYLNITPNDILEPASNLDNPTTKTFFVSVRFDENSGVEPSNIAMTNNLKLSFVQAN